MSSLYEIIDDLRREHPTPAASRTLDLVVGELGRTQDNLRQALAGLAGTPVPAEGKKVLDELEQRARAEGVDDLETPLPKEELDQYREPIDESEIGIAVLLGGSAAVTLLLAVVVTVAALNQILHFY